MKKFLLLLLGGCSLSEVIISGIEDAASPIQVKTQKTRHVGFSFINGIMKAIRPQSASPRTVASDNMSPSKISVQESLSQKSSLAHCPTPDCNLNKLAHCPTPDCSLNALCPTPKCSLESLVNFSASNLERHPTPKCSLENLSAQDGGSVNGHEQNRMRSYSIDSTSSYCIGELPPSSPQLSRTRTWSSSSLAGYIAMSKKQHSSFGSNGSNEELQTMFAHKKSGLLHHLTPPTSPKADSSDQD